MGGLRTPLGPIFLAGTVTIPETTMEHPTETLVTSEPVPGQIATTEIPIGSAAPNSTRIFLLAALVLVAAALVCAVIRSCQVKKKNAEKQESTEKSQTVATKKEAPAPIPSIRLAACQGQGDREDQQDSYGSCEPGEETGMGVIAVVADGMGGLSNGSIVSSALVRIFKEGFQRIGSYTPPGRTLLELAAEANDRINQMLQSGNRSGSTLVSVIVRSGYLFFLSIGDSRIYLYRNGGLIQLTREHIFREELALKAVNRTASFDQMQLDRQAHSLTSYFGSGSISFLDRNENGIKLKAGDRILLCSDGIFGTLSGQQLEQALSQELSAAAQAIGDMVEQASRPRQDNYTALILEYRG